MLAGRRSLKFAGNELERTPLLVPSFSSKGFPYVADIIRLAEEVIDGPILVSAYDLHYGIVTPPFDFASLIFLDSGGYEASKDFELSDFDDSDYRSRAWSREMHQAVLANWRSTVPSVLVGYDHPKDRLPFHQQIDWAASMAVGRTDVLRELLIKPETEGQKFVNIDAFIRHVGCLDAFDVIGATEKELGSSILARMESIAKLRIALCRVGLDTPIHVFGSLDTITTPLYFLAGADIFDGLTWLRFAFHEGYTMYKHNYGAVELGLSIKADALDGRCWFHNYRYLIDLQLDMRRFLKDRDFQCFRHHAELFQKAHESVTEAVGA